MALRSSYPSQRPTVSSSRKKLRALRPNPMPSSPRPTIEKYHTHDHRPDVLYIAPINTSHHHGSVECPSRRGYLFEEPFPEQYVLHRHRALRRNLDIRYQSIHPSRDHTLHVSYFKS